MRRTLLLIAALIVLTVVAYWPVHHYGFVAFDDGPYVYKNARLHAGFNAAGLKYAFTTFAMGNWNPLLWLSFFLDHGLFDLRPGAMHVENVLLHLIAGILVWRLLVLATGNFYRSWFVAAIFLVHPMHVESVAWISERKDVLSTPLLIGAMICYVKFAIARTQTPVLRHAEGPDFSTVQPSASACCRTGVWSIYALMLGLFALSLMAKTMGVTLPAVLLLMDFWPLRRWPKTSWVRLVTEKIPLFAFSLAGSIVGNIAQRHTGSTTSLRELGMVDRIDNALVCYVLYAVKLIAPQHLAILYRHPAARPAAAVFAAAVLLVLITIVFVRLRRVCPYLIIGWLWFVGTLVPVIGLVQIGGQSMADRYSYFPSIGFLICFTWGIADLIHRLLHHRPQRELQVATALASIVIILFTGLTNIQVRYWRDAETLFTHALNVGEDSAPAHLVLGQAAYSEHDIVKAVNECIAALKFGPDARAYCNLGNCFVGVDPERAIGYFQQAVNFQPQSVEFRRSLAMGFRLGKHLDKAKAAAQTALDMDPNDPETIQEMKDIQSAIATRH